VDTHTGLLLAKAHKAPNQIATIYSLWCWIARYGTLVIIESDQGTHFTGAVIQKWASTMDIQWNYHLPYNPTAAGNIERHNGLLKLKLAHLSDTPIHKALEIACFELNSRYRLYRRI
jgi:transposase InsO family protein